LRDVRREPLRDTNLMKTPVGLVTIALTIAILLAASLLIASGTHGEDREPATRILSRTAK
jgi:hypothetical protein